MNPSERRLSDGPAMERFIAAMARRLADARRGGVPLQLVGIRTRGVPLAHRLARELTPLLDLEVPVGAVDITSAPPLAEDRDAKYAHGVPFSLVGGFRGSRKGEAPARPF